jgi:hypothetical protein
MINWDFDWNGLGWILSVWILVCSRCEASVHVLATGGMPVSVGHLGPQV